MNVGPFECFARNLEAANGKHNRQVVAQCPNPFQIGDLVVKATVFQVGKVTVKLAAQPGSLKEKEEEPYLVAGIILGGYCKLVNTDILEGVTIHSRWLKPFNAKNVV